MAHKKINKQNKFCIIFFPSHGEITERNTFECNSSCLRSYYMYKFFFNGRNMLHCNFHFYFCWKSALGQITKCCEKKNVSYIYSIFQVFLTLLYQLESLPALILAKIFIFFKNIWKLANINKELLRKHIFEYFNHCFFIIITNV